MMIVIGFLVLLFGWGASENGDGSAGIWIGGGLMLVGLLGFVIRSSTGAAIDDTPDRPVSGNITDELQKAADLHASGAITGEEFAAVKKRLLGG